VSTIKFRVLLAGDGFYLVTEERRWLRRRRVVSRCGFFTTRWVEAATTVEAAEVAKAMVLEELKDRSDFIANGPDQPWTVTVEEVTEDEAGFDEFGPGAGFTWYDDTNGNE